MILVMIRKNTHKNNDWYDYVTRERLKTKRSNYQTESSITDLPKIGFQVDNSFSIVIDVLLQ